MNERPTIDAGKAVSRHRFLRHVAVGAVGLAAAACAAIPARYEAYRRIRELKGS